MNLLKEAEWKSGLTPAIYLNFAQSLLQEHHYLRSAVLLFFYEEKNFPPSNFDSRCPTSGFIMYVFALAPVKHLSKKILSVAKIVSGEVLFSIS
ncbi:hypothetical protein NPIL_185161 [Nephila pilipes]|uniref:Uncharacterized protein n=1 Tax=Nephila pilipes TaxID=299642 RepID=A0A8X6Q8B2_NEPPI|nr:hypothetical protein NPIL_185161 [Nephila pilipes]